MSSSTKIYINNKKIKNDVLVAITSDEQQNGLMFVDANPPIMAFPYKTADVRKFWMKNTLVPLDIVFCKAGLIVDIKYGMPLDESLIGPNEKIDLVVEFPLGFCNKNNIVIGNNINIKYDKHNLRKLLNDK